MLGRWNPPYRLHKGKTLQTQPSVETKQMEMHRALLGETTATSYCIYLLFKFLVATLKRRPHPQIESTFFSLHQDKTMALGWLLCLSASLSIMSVGSGISLGISSLEYMICQLSICTWLCTPGIATGSERKHQLDYQTVSWRLVYSILHMFGPRPLAESLVFRQLLCCF